MKTKCPACGATTSLDALLGHSDASKAFVSALSVTGDLQHPLIKYLAMFRSESRDLTFERAAKLISEIAPDITATNLEHSLQNIRRIEFPSNFECEECGSVIPEQRRRLGSVTLCVGCQTALEAKQKHLRG